MTQTFKYQVIGILGNFLQIKRENENPIEKKNSRSKQNSAEHFNNWRQRAEQQVSWKRKKADVTVYIWKHGRLPFEVRWEVEVV